MDLPRPAAACLPPWWARGPHLQTIAAQYYPSPTPARPWERLRLELGDGDALAVQALPGPSGVAVVLFHGLGGSVDGHYMRRAAARCSARGHSVLAVNHRGAGAGAGWARGIYHSGATGDMAAALRLGRELFPGQLQVAVGFSISANILLLLAGRDRHLDQPDRAIAVNPPADLDACSLRLCRGFNRVYDQYFVRRLSREMRSRGVPAPRGPVRTLRDFDEAVTAPMAGFRDRADYYARCACGPHLAGVQAPTVILSAGDDPFAPASDIRAFPLAAAIHFHEEATGGHMGYFARNIPGHRWLDHALEHYLDTLVGLSK